MTEHQPGDGESGPARSHSEREAERAQARAEHEAFLTHEHADVPVTASGEDDGDPRGLVPGERARSAVIASAAAAPAVTLGDQPVSGISDAAFRPSGRRKVRLGDRIFRYLTTGSGLFVVALITLVALFLIIKAVPSVFDDKVNFFTSREWSVTSRPLRFGIVDMLWTTLLSSFFAMVLAVPVAIGIALFITQYAPARLARPVAFLVDLLAAIPSIIYGIWGIYVLAPKLVGIRTFLSDKLDWIPLFKQTSNDVGTVFAAGVVLAIMILPIITAIAREVYQRTPTENVEAAWALGATRWEMIRLAVLPYGRPGVISGAMLGLGRALGETIALTLILSTAGAGSPFSASLFAGGETFASKIANAAAEFNDPRQTGAYIAAGLVLFILTFAVNAAARIVVNRRREFS